MRRFFARLKVDQGDTTGVEIEQPTTRTTPSAKLGSVEVRGGGNNLGVGVDALKVSTGDNNTALGARALSKYTGSNVTAIGENALQNLTSGEFNTAIGANTLSSTTTGDLNTAIGRDSLQNNTVGTENTGIGWNSLNNNSTGRSNTAVGPKSLQSNTTGIDNTAIGPGALYTNTTGSQNTAAGPDALVHNTTGDGNVALGYQAGMANVTGHDNVAIGSRSMGGDASSVNASGWGNIAIGPDTLRYTTTGSGNVAIGNSALEVIFETGLTTTTPDYVGVSSAIPNDVLGKFNVAVGEQAGNDGVSFNLLHFHEKVVTDKVILVTIGLGTLQECFVAGVVFQFAVAGSVMVLGPRTKISYDDGVTWETRSLHVVPTTAVPSPQLSAAPLNASNAASDFPLPGFKVAYYDSGDPSKHDIPIWENDPTDPTKRRLKDGVSAQIQMPHSRSTMVGAFATTTSGTESIAIGYKARTAGSNMIQLGNNDSHYPFIGVGDDRLVPLQELKNIFKPLAGVSAGTPSLTEVVTALHSIAALLGITPPDPSEKPGEHKSVDLAFTVDGSGARTSIIDIPGKAAAKTVPRASGTDISPPWNVHTLYSNLYGDEFKASEELGGLAP